MEGFNFCLRTSVVGLVVYVYQYTFLIAQFQYLGTPKKSVHHLIFQIGYRLIIFMFFGVDLFLHLLKLLLQFIEFGIGH